MAPIYAVPGLFLFRMVIELDFPVSIARSEKFDFCYVETLHEAMNPVVSGINA